MQTLDQALPESYAGLFHAAKIGNSLLLLAPDSELTKALDTMRPKRQIGVIYARATERQSHYMQTQLTRQFDAVIHLDRTGAVSPLR